MSEVSAVSAPKGGSPRASPALDPIDPLSQSVNQTKLSEAELKGNAQDHNGGGPGEDVDELDDDSEDEDRYRLVSAPQRSLRISEKKRLDTAAFQLWIEKNQRESSKADVKSPDRQSIADLLGTSSAPKIISTPREYQLELFERAKQKNTIVVLDTGSGKTLISALLLRHILDQELENRAAGKGNKVAFFLVEKVALCVQQHGVLSANLEHQVAMFHGDSKMVKTKEFWDEQLSHNMVIVCTAQILLDCLNAGFVRIAGINLLIFDEAHHTKKNHPYARIIKNHYLREQGERPRVLGMTASPVDAQARDVRAVAAELESLMCSEIATVSDEALAAGQARRSQIESVEYYDRLGIPWETKTKLWVKIVALVGNLSSYFGGTLHLTRDASSELGSWCADRYWHLLMTDAEVARLIAKTGQAFNVSQGDRATDAIREAQKLVQQHALEPISKSSRGGLLSQKTDLLAGILEDAFCHRGTKRCIVFVEKRYTALLLADLFQQKGMAIPGMDVAYMVGSNAISSSIANMSFRDQAATLEKLRRGEFNCLFATTVAEEGIDIPECDLIIRFDMYCSAIQYIQSKGRARQAESRYINMVQRGNLIDVRRLKQAIRDATALRKFCSALPVDRKVQDVVIDAETIAQHELVSQKAFDIPSTGARLTLSYSLEVLAKFVSSLPQVHALATPDYVVTTLGKKFIADVILPDTSPVRTVSGYAQRSKQLARCSAAFEACVLLIQKKHINEHLQPVFAKKLPAMRNARLAVNSKKRGEYPMRISPDIWSRLGPPTELFVTAVALDAPDAVGNATKPLLLLTREALPSLPGVPLFFDGRSSMARLVSSPKPIRLSPKEVALLEGFTLKVFADVFSKEYEATAAELPYFLSPCTVSHEGIRAEESPHIDWELLQTIQSQEYLNWENAPETFFNDKFVVDLNDGSRKLILHGLNKDLKPSNATPSGVPEPKCRAYRFVEQTVKEYSNSLWLKARKRAQWEEDQPVVNADLLSLRRNLLDEFCGGDNGKPTRCYIILEPLKVSTLPVPIVFMALNMPAILYRVDSNLIALDACSLLDLKIRPDLALEAVTKDSDNTEDHGAEQIDFQAGMGNNYERLEFLGDSFLKMATTISIFTLIPDSDEFEYHVERMLLVCNQNLFNHAIDRSLQEYIRSKSFDRRTWYPNLKLRKGKAPKNEVRHSVADKSVADVCEALIGAAYLSPEAEGDMDMAVKAVTKMVKSKNHSMTTFGAYYKAFKVPQWQCGEPSAAQRFAVDRVAEAIGYRFQSPALLRSAFKHSSYPYEPALPNYQRLEFLGDALLDMAIVDYLFRRYPAADPQWLTEHKMAMASNQFLGCLCVKLGLHRHLLATTYAITDSVARYVSDLEAVEGAARREAAGADEQPRRDFWLQASHPPKALPDMLEAVVGAMFVDARYDYGAVRRFFDALVRPYFEDMALYDTFAGKHPVTALGRRLQDDLRCRRWRICTSGVPCGVEEGAAALTDSDVVCALVVHGRVVAHETGKSGRYAKVRVAKEALAMVAEMDREAYWAEFGCDCDEGHGTAA